MREPRMTLILERRGAVAVATSARPPEVALRPYQYASLKQHDLIWFSRLLSKGATIDREYQLGLVEDQYFGRTDGFAKGLIGTVRGDEIVRLIGDPNFPQEVDDSLFADNIRLYLGEENDINH
jgi:hypothetical protein